MREQGEAVRAARAEADGTLDARAPEVASTSALSALLKGFKTLDRDRSGRLQAGEFAAVIGEASLGLTHGEVRGEGQHAGGSSGWRVACGVGGWCSRGWAGQRKAARKPCCLLCFLEGSGFHTTRS